MVKDAPTQSSYAPDTVHMSFITIMIQINLVMHVQFLFKLSYEKVS